MRTTEKELPGWQLLGFLLWCLSGGAVLLRGMHIVAAGGAEFRVRRDGLAAVGADRQKGGAAVGAETGGGGVAGLAVRADRGVLLQDGAGAVDDDLHAAGQEGALDELEDFFRHPLLAEGADAGGDGEGPGGEDAGQGGRADLVGPLSLADGYGQDVADDHELGGDGEPGAGDGFPAVAGLAGLEDVLEDWVSMDLLTRQ